MSFSYAAAAACVFGFCFCDVMKEYWRETTQTLLNRLHIHDPTYTLTHTQKWNETEQNGMMKKNQGQNETSCHFHYFIFSHI